MAPGEDRFYRSFERPAGGRVPFRVRVATSDLYLRADRDLSREALDALRRVRGQVEAHVRARPAFATALRPLEPPAGPVPPVVRAMYAAAAAAGVGPMAAVAGAVAGAVGRELRPLSREVLVENGGDLFLALRDAAVVGLHAGDSPFSGRLGLRIDPSETPLGVSTSSGTVGPSLSYGRADLATVLAADPALADAVATAAANRVHGPSDVAGAVAWAVDVPGVAGAVVACGDRLGAAGRVVFEPIHAQGPATDP